MTRDDLASLLVSLSRLGLAPRPVAQGPMPHSALNAGRDAFAMPGGGGRSMETPSVGDLNPGRTPITLAPILDQWIADPGGPTAPPAPLGPVPEPPKMPALTPSPVPDVLVLRPPRPLSSTALESIALESLGGPPPPPPEPPPKRKPDPGSDDGFKRGGLVRGGDPRSKADDVEARPTWRVRGQQACGGPASPRTRSHQRQRRRNGRSGAGQRLRGRRLSR
jgi:hypothetical protein